jgi:DinB superfamily
MHSNSTHLQLLVNMTLTSWNAQNKYFNNLLETYTEEQFSREVAPGKNTGTYLVGHLIAVSDAMLPLLGFGTMHYPELENIFIKNPDNSGLQKPGITELKENLKAVNAALDKHFNSLSVEEWFEPHTAVSTDGFAKEPHRNKLNVVISRTNHMANHIGQLLLLK